MKIRMKKAQWEDMGDGHWKWDTGFLEWWICPDARILLNDYEWHRHSTVEGAKIMVENRMREYVNGLIKVDITNKTTLSMSDVSELMQPNIPFFD